MTQYKFINFSDYHSFLIKLVLLFIPIFIVPNNVNASEKKELLWASDANSGAPFSFRDPKNPNEIIGLDVDVANGIAEVLNLKAKFIQNTWDGLIPGLLAKNYDIVIDGLEIVQDRMQSIAFSTPYYITTQQIVVNKNNTSIFGPQDLIGKNVGTLPSSLAQKVLLSIDGVNIKYYPEEVNAFEDLALGNRLDAVVIDDAIAKYYAGPNPKLKLLNIPLGKMLYGVGIRKNDQELIIQINSALENMKKSGKLRLILEKWGLWNNASALAWNQSKAPQTEPTGYLNFVSSNIKEKSFKDSFYQYLSYVPLLAKGAVTTLEISILAMFLAMTLGLGIALVRLYAPKFLQRLAILYIEIIRGTPLLIQLYLIFYGLPHINIHFSPLTSAVLGLGLNYAASEAENYRAGILAVPRNQMDASLALGMTRIKALRHIIIPQALRIVIPPVTNDFIALIKDSSLVSVITLVELTTVYSQLATTYFDYLGIGILTACMYLLIGLPFARLSRMAEKRFSLYYRTLPKQSKFPST